MSEETDKVACDGLYEALCADRKERPREYRTDISANTDPQLLLGSGPMLLRDFNPRGVLRFQGRKCVTCGGEIMDHWLRDNMDASLKGLYWCTRDGDGFSAGLDSTVWDVPEGFGK